MGQGGIKKNAGLNMLLYYIGEQAPLTSCTATALVRCSFADAVLGTWAQSPGWQEQQPLLQEVYLQSLHL